MEPSSIDSLISIKEASELSGYSADYLSRLLRAKKITGAQSDRVWKVDRDSLKAFILVQDKRKRELADSYARARREEYRAKAPKTEVMKLRMRELSRKSPKLPTSEESVKAFVSLLRHAGAATAAVLVVATGAYAAEGKAAAELASNARATAREAAYGFGLIKDDFAGVVASRIASVHEESEKSANAAQKHFAYEAPRIDMPELALAEGSDVYAFVPEAVSFQTRDAADAAPVTIGEAGLAFGAHARDALAALPHAALSADLAFAGALVDTSSAITDAYASFARGTAAAAPASARATLVALYTLGDRTGALAAATPAAGAHLALGAANAFNESSFALARGIVNGEIALGSALTGASHGASGATIASGASTVHTAYAAASAPAATLAKTGTAAGTLGGATIALVRTGSSEPAATLPASVASALPAPLADAADGALSAISRFAFSVFSVGSRALAFVLEPNPPLALAPTPADAPFSDTVPAAQAAPSAPAHAGAATYVTNVTNVYPTTGGVSQAYVDTSVATLRDYVLRNIDSAVDSLQGGTTVIHESSGGSGSGSVTSVNVSGGTTGLTVSGGPVTDSGTLTLGGILTVAHGGTGLSTAPAYGELLVGNGAGGYALIATSSLGITGGGGPGSDTWGAITGNISDQTDLQNALNAKLATSAFGSSFYTFFHATTTDALAEGSTNQYFTNARVQSYLDSIGKGYFFSTTSASYFLAQNQSAAFSTTSASYLLSTYDKGYFFSTTSANYWKASNDFFSTTSAQYFLTQNTGNAYSTTSANYWLTTKTTSDLAEGSNLYFTNSRVASVIAGTTTDALAEGSTNKYYTDARATANFVSNLAATSSVASITTLPSLSLPLTQTTGTLAINRGGTGTTTAPTYGKLLIGNAGGTYDLVATSSLGITSAAWGNITGTLSNQTDLQNALNAKLDSNAFGSNFYTYFHATTTDALTEGSTNKYYTDARVLTYLNTLDKGFFFSTTSANAWLGTKSTTDLAEGSNLYFTTARATSNFIANLAATTSVASITALPNLSLATSQLTGTLGVANGGTGSTTLTGILGGNGTGAVKTIVVGSGLAFDGSTLSSTAGGGSVTSVDASGGTTGLSFTGGPITGAGTLTLGGTLSQANGGTGATSFGSPFYTYFHATTTDALAEGSTNKYYTDARATANFISNLSATTSVASITTLPSLSLPTSQLSGTVGVANGGTGTTTGGVTGGVEYFDGTKLTNNASFYYDGSGHVGIGTNSNLNGSLTLNGTVGTQAEGDIFREYDSGDAAWYPIIARYNTANGSFPGSTYIFGDGTNANVGIEKPGGSNVVSFHVHADTTSLSDALTVGSTLQVTGQTTLATSLSGILKAASGVVSVATAGTDYFVPSAFGSSFYTFFHATTTDALTEGSTNKYYTDARVLSYLNSIDKGYFFSTTSANYWKASNDFFSTTSSNYWLTTKTTSDLAEGSNLYFTNSRVASVIAGTTTDALAEGSTNKYYTDTRATNNFISNLSATTSVASITTLPNLSLPYSQLTGTPSTENPLTFTYPLTRSTNTISLAFGTTTGNTWGGTQIFTNAPKLGSLTGFVGANGGVLYQIASSSLDLPNSALQNSSITVNGTLFNLGDSHTITAASSTLLADNNTFSGTNTFSNPISGSVTGNAGTVTNGVYTTTFGGLFYNLFHATTTDALTQGSTNKYYSTNLFAADLAGTTTSALAEGTNLYFTSARATANFISNLAATTSVASITTLPNLVLPVSQLSGDIDLGSQVTGTLAQGNGGTGITSYTAGDVLYADNTGTLQKLPAGGNGQVLKLQAGLPAWGVDETVGSGGNDGIFALATTSGTDLISPLDTSSILLVGTNATTTNNSIFEVSGQQYISSKLGIATTSPSAALSVGGSGLFSGTLAVTGTGTSTFAGNGLFANLAVSGLSGLVKAGAGGYLSSAIAGTDYVVPSALNNYLALSAWYATTTDALAEGSTNKYYTDTRATNNFISNLSATTSVASITTLPNLSLPYSQLTGTPSTENPLTFTYPLTRSTNTISLAFGTTTANSWSALQQFNGGASTTALSVTGADTRLTVADTDASGQIGIDFNNSANRVGGILIDTNSNRLDIESMASGGGSVGGRITLTNTGNVGIGTTSPFAKLTVGGAAYVGGNLTATGTVAFTGLSSGLVYSTNGTLSSVSTSTWTFASSTLLADNNTFSGTNTFSNPISGSVTGNAGTVTNGVYTTTFGGLFYNLFHATTTDALAEGSTNLYFTSARATANFISNLAATTSVASITTLPSLSLPLTQTTGTLAINRGGTGTSSAPAYGQFLLGNASGGYDFVSTSTLGLAPTFTATYPIQYSGNVLSLAFGTTTSNTWAGTQTFTNPIAVGSGTGTSTFNGNLGITGNIVPSAADTYSLGSIAYPFKDMFVGPGSLYVNGQEVIHTNLGDDVIVSADPTQNLQIKTSSGGALQLNPGTTGNIQVMGPVSVTAGKAITTTDSSALSVPVGVAAGNITVSGNIIAASNLNGGISITPNGSGNTYVTAGNFGIGTTSPTNKLEVNGNAYIGGNLTVTGGASLLSNATTSSLAITGVTSSLLKTNSTGSVVPAVAGTDYFVPSNFGSSFYTFFHATTTDALAEGSTNKYYTDARVQSYLDTINKGYFFSTTSADYWKTQNNFFSTTSSNYWLTTKTTSDLAEGTNLYYTLNRFAAALAGTTTDALAEGSINKYYTDARATANFISNLSATSSVSSITALPNLSLPTSQLSGTIALGSQVSGTLPVANGGTGSTTLSGILKGNGTGAVQTAVPGTDYQTPLIAGTDYEHPLTFNYPLTRSTNAISLAFGTSTSNTWGGTQTFSAAPTFSSLSSGGLAVNASGGVYAAATTTAGTGLSYSGNAFNVNTTQNISQLSNLSTAGFVKTDASGNLSVDTNTYLTSAVTSLKQSYGSAQTGAVTLATSSAATSNGVTVGQTITNSSGTFTFTPTVSVANIPNSALANSSITVNGTLFNLGDSHTITAASSTLLADDNTFSGTNTFSNTINGSVTGNAGTVTNGVYTTTFNSLFDPRFITDLAATSSVSSITALPNLSLPTSQLSGTIALGSQVSGTLPVANGGTGTTTTTAGSIIFSNGSNYTEDNGGLFYDATNHRLGLGTTTPQTAAHFYNGSGSEVLRIQGVNASGTAGQIQLSNDTGTIGQFSSVGSTASGSNLALIPNSFNVTALSTGGLAIGASNASGVVRIFTGGATTANERVRIDASGNVGIGTTSPSATLAVQGNAYVSGNIANVANVTATGTITTPNLTVGSLSGLLKAASGVVSAAVDGTDFISPSTFGSSFYTYFHATTTDALAEGSTNKYYTDARATANFISNLAATSSVASITTLPNLLLPTSQLSGVLSIAHGGTGTSTAPTYGKLLLGNAAGGYDYVATSSLGIEAGVSSVSNADGSLTISPTSGAVVASLNPAHANTFTALQQFSNASSTLATLGTTWLSGLTNAVLSTNASGQIVATTSIGTATLAGTVSITNGGTGTSTGGVTNGVEYYNGSTLTNNAGFTYNGTDVALAGGLSAGSIKDTGITNAITYANGSGTLGAVSLDPIFDFSSGNLSLNYGAGLGYSALSGLINTGVLSFNGRAGAVSPASGDYTTDQVTEGTNLYFTNNRVASVIAGTTTDALAEGSTNKYYTDTRATANFISNLSATTSVASITTLPNLSLPTSQLSGTLGVAHGGTGSTTLSGLLKGNGTGSIQTAVPGVDYQAPLIAGTDYENPLTFTYPLTRSTNTISLAFGTTTANSWSGLQQFNGGASTTQFTSTGNTYLATAGGSVGIGTTSPMSALAVTAASGNPTISIGNPSSSGVVTIANAGGTATFNTTGGNSYFFNEGGTTALQIGGTASVYVPNGNLGVGTTTPGATFAVQGNGLFSGNVALANLTATGTATVGNLINNGLTANTLIYANGSKQETSVAAGTDGYVLALSGGVPTWVATSSINNGVSSIKQTYGSAQTGAITLATSSAATSNGVTVGLGVTNSSGTFTFAPTVSVSAIPNSALANSTISGVALGTNLNSLSHNSTLSGTSYNGSAAVSDWGLNLSNANTWTALQQFNGNASTTQITATGGAYLATTGGNVGVGTAAPTAKLDVQTSYSTTGFPLSVKNSGYYNAYFQGTSANNQASFYMENDRGSFASYGGFLYGGSTSTLGSLFGAPSRADRLFMFADGASNLGYYVGTLSAAPFVIGTNNLERLRVDSAGNVGIATSSPFAKLSVAGATYVGGNLTATGTVAFTGLSSGFVGSNNGTLYTFASSTLTAASSTLLADNNTFSGNNTFSNTITGSISGNAGTATKLQTARTIGGVSFDGSANISLTSGSSILKGNGSGGFANATAGTDYENPLTFTYPLTRSTNTISLAFGTTTANSWSGLQQFNGNASTTGFTNSGSTWLTGLASALLSTDAAGKIVATTTLGGNISVPAANLTGSVAVANGGTGSTTLTGILKGNGTGGVQTAIPGTDYLTSNQTITLSGDVSGSGSTAITTTYNNVVPANKGGAGTVSGILKANGSGTVSAAIAGTDYLDPSSFGSSFYTYFHATTTDALAEGSTNKYYTDARVGSYLTGSTTLPAFLNYWTKSGSNITYKTGNVGIGSGGNYEAPLHVNLSDVTGGPDADALLALEDGAHDVVFNFLTSRTLKDSIYFGDQDNSNNGNIIYDNNTDSMSFATNQVQRLVINSSGKVGIGTTSPSQVLSVQGGGLFSGNLSSANLTATGTVAFTGLSSGFVGSNNGTLYTFASSTLTAASSTLLADNNTFSGTNTFSNTITGSISGNAGTVTNGVYTTTFNGLADARFITDLAATSSVSSITTLPNLSLPYSQITGAPAAAGYPFAGAGNSTSTLTQFNGGLTAFASSTIGDGTQAGGLTVNGGATTTGNAYIAGNVGIGINAPTATLDVQNASGAATLNLEGNSSTNSTTFTIRDGNDASNLFGSQVNPSGTSNTSFANVPSSATFQTGSGTTGGLIFFNKAAAPVIFATGGNSFASERLRITGTGEVGVGTTSPFAKLSVVGNGFFTGNVTGANVTATGTLAVNGTGTSTFAGPISGTNLALSGLSTGLVKVGAGGYLQNAVSGTDYQAPITTGNLTVGSNLSVTGGTGAVIGSGASISLGSNVVTGVTNDTNVTGSISGNTLTLGWTGALGIARGGTGTTTGGVTNGVEYYDGSKLTNGNSLVFSSGKLGVGTPSPASQLTVEGSTGLQVSYDASDYTTLRTNISGNLTIAPTGGQVSIAGAEIVNGALTSGNLTATGTVQFSALNSAGFVKTDASGNLSVDTNTYLTSSGAVTSIKQSYGSTQAGAVTLATSSAATSNGVTVGQTITNSGGTFTFTPTVSVSGIPTSALAANTISGVALGSNLNSLSHDSTLSGTSYNGSAAVSDWGLNLAHANTFTALQQFNGNASTTGFTNSGSTWLTGLANALLSTDANGKVVATTSIGTNLLTGTLAVANGGTGSTTLSGILKGNGTGAVQTAVAGTDYQAPITTGNLTGSPGLSVTGGTDAVIGSGTSISLSSSVVTGFSGGTTNITGSISSNTLTLGWSGALGITRGGTNATSFTSGQPLYYNGTSFASASVSSPLSFSGGAFSLGTVPVSKGGTNATSQTTNGVAYYDGTSLTTGSDLVFDGTNLGIGTTPSYTLDVAGDINFTGTLYQNGVPVPSSPFTLDGNSNFFAASLGSLAINTSGSNNFAAGNTALSSNTSGFDNIAIGLSTLGSNDSGAGNTALGDNALIANVDGSNNTAIGSGAMVNNISGSDNAAIGAFALALSTGSRNIALGSGALGGLSSGDDNLGFGYGVGSSLSSGSNNIFIGNQVDAPDTAGSNQLNIGNLLYGTGLYDGTSGASSAYAGGKIGIGTSTPNWLLSLEGDNAALHIKTDVDTAGAIAVENASGVNTFQIDTVDSADALLTVATSTGSVYFVVGADGTTGVGTSTPTPASSLAVAAHSVTSGNAYAGYFDATPAAGLTGSAYGVYGKAVGSMGSWGEFGVYGESDDTGTGVYGTATGGTGVSGSGSTGVQATGTNYALYATGAKSYFSTNVGIATTSPWKALSVAGDISLTGALYDKNASAGSNGYVLQSTGSGTQWVATSTLGFGSAGVTSVNASGGTTGLTFSGGPITSTGTLTLGGTLAVANGGTGTTTQVTNGVNYYDGSKITSDPTKLSFTGTNFGIGTSSPNWMLSLAGTNASLHIKTTTNISSAFAIENATGRNILQVDTIDNASSIFSVATSTGTTYFTVGAGGNVGVGTTSPWGSLSVQDNSQNTSKPLFVVGSSTDTYLSLFKAPNSPSGQLLIGTTTTQGQYPFIVDSAQSGSTAGFALFNSSGGNISFDLISGSIANSAWRLQDTSKNFTVRDQTNGVNVLTVAQGAPVNSLYVAAAGVGIGTSSPAATFAVSGTTYLSSDLTFNNGAGFATSHAGANPDFAIRAQSGRDLSLGAGGTSGLLYIKSNGNVSIGTTTPTFVTGSYSGLHINTSTTGASLHLTNSTSGSMGTDGLDIALGSANANIVDRENGGSLNFYTTTSGGSTNNNLTIDPDGNVTIPSTGTAALTVGNGTTGYINLGANGFYDDGSYLSPIGGQPFYVRTTTPTTYLYSANTYLGNSSGSAIHLRGNTFDWTSGQGGLIDTNGNLLIGETSAQFYASTRGLVEINGSATSILAMSHGGTYEGYLYDTGSSMRLLSQDNLQFYVNGAASINFTASYLSCTALTTNASRNLVCTTSDQRVKQDIAPIAPTNALDAIARLNPVSFEYKPGIDQDPGTRFGLIAQQVANVFPNLVSTTSPTQYTPDGTYQVDYMGLIAPSIAAIQQLDARTRFITNNAATSTQALTVDVSGNIGVKTTTPTAALTVNGDASVSGTVSASAFSVNGAAFAAQFTLPASTVTGALSSLGFGTTTIPSAVMTASSTVDLAKLASYNLGTTAALAARVAADEVRMDSLESRIAKLESGAVGMATSSPVTFSTSTLADALHGFGVMIANNIAQFDTLVARQFVAATDSNGQSVAGSGTVLAGNTVVEIDNAYAKPSSKILITMTSAVDGNWYLSDKADGSFRVHLASAQQADVTFDYLIIETEGQLATPSAASTTPNGTGTTTTDGDGVTHTNTITIIGTNPDGSSTATTTPIGGTGTTTDSSTATSTSSGTATTTDSGTGSSATTTDPGTTPPPASDGTGGTASSTESGG